MEKENKNNSQQSIVEYVIQKLNEKINGDEIKQQLHAVGWSEDEIDNIYATALSQYGVPAPNRGDEKIFSKKSSAGEIVINIFSFVALGFVAVNFGILCYNVIDYFFVDSSNVKDLRISSEAIHYAIAVLLIGFPMYYFSIRFWFSQFKKDEGKIESRLTKWITYIVLLMGSIVIVGDLVAVLFFFLQGEITMRFFLKALVIFIISGGIFGFYFFERKRIQYKKEVSKKVFYVFGVTSVVLILISIVLGFLVAGSPSTERSRTFDEVRSDSLYSIAGCVSGYSKEYKKMPTSLDFIETTSGYDYCGEIEDPKTGKVYEYNIVSKLKETDNIFEGEFELCADFELAADETTIGKRSSRSLNKWDIHSEGRNCDREQILIKEDRIIDEINVNVNDVRN